MHGKGGSYLDGEAESAEQDAFVQADVALHSLLKIKGRGRQNKGQILTS